ncbi:hypothetical protein ACFLR5_01110 [Elusimicrobiota bacterium]
MYYTEIYTAIKNESMRIADRFDNLGTKTAFLVSAETAAFATNREGL